jgi:serine protease DegQ
MEKRVMVRIIRAVSLVATIVAAGSGAAGAGAPVEISGQSSGAPTLVAVLREILPAVIDIEARRRVTQVAIPASYVRRRTALSSNGRGVAVRREVVATGSGVVIDAGAGLIVTNSHVIDRAETITVRLADGRKLDAVKVGSDPDTDVAVIKVQALALTAIRLGDSDKLEVGESVFAIGNPLRLGQTVSSGIVSGLHRRNIGVVRYEDFIQTDAAIYPGNSGGALIDLRGRLVGINTAFVGAGKGNPGLGFAIPLNMVRAIVDQILEYGEVRRGTFGVTLEDTSAGPQRGPAFSAPHRGAVVVKVELRSTAEYAGLRLGDIVTAFDGTPVHDASHLRTRMALRRNDEIAELMVLRDGGQIIIRAGMTQAAPHANPKR